MFVFGVPIRLRASLLDHSSIVCWTLLPLVISFLFSMEGESPKNVELVIHVIVNTFDRLTLKTSSLVGSFCCIIC